MSKRSATGQGDSRNGFKDLQEQGDTPPVKATAAQMASRRVLSAKARRTAPSSNFNPGSSLQAFGNPFASITPNTANVDATQTSSSNMFNSQQNNSVFGSPQTQNNQPFGSPTTQNSTIPSAQSSVNNNPPISFAAPTGGFSFSAGANNPFNQSSTPAFGGFGQPSGSAQGQQHNQQQFSGNDNGMQVSPPTTPAKEATAVQNSSVFGTAGGKRTGGQAFGTSAQQPIAGHAHSVSYAQFGGLSTQKPDRRVYTEIPSDIEHAYAPGHEPQQPQLFPEHPGKILTNYIANDVVTPTPREQVQPVATTAPIKSLKHVEPTPTRRRQLLQNPQASGPVSFTMAPAAPQPSALFQLINSITARTAIQVEPNTFQMQPPDPMSIELGPGRTDDLDLAGMELGPPSPKPDDMESEPSFTQFYDPFPQPSHPFSLSNQQFLQSMQLGPPTSEPEDMESEPSLTQSYDPFPQPSHPLQTIKGLPQFHLPPPYTRSTHSTTPPKKQPTTQPITQSTTPSIYSSNYITDTDPMDLQVPDAPTTPFTSNPFMLSGGISSNSQNPQQPSFMLGGGISANPQNTQQSSFSFGGGSSANIQKPPQSPFPFGQASALATSQPSQNQQQSIPSNSFSFGAKQSEPSATDMTTSSFKSHSTPSIPFGGRTHGDQSNSSSSQPSASLFQTSSSSFPPFGGNSGANTNIPPTSSTPFSSNALQSSNESSFKGFGTPTAQNAPQIFNNDLFSRVNKPADSGLTANNAPTHDLFSRASKPAEPSTATPASNPFSSFSKPPTTPTTVQQHQPSPFPAVSNPQNTAAASSQPTPSATTNSMAGNANAKLILGTSPASFDDEQKRRYLSHLQLVRLNDSFRKILLSMDDKDNWSDMMRAYLSQHDRIVGSRLAGTAASSAVQASISSNKRKIDEEAASEGSKRPRANITTNGTPSKSADDNLGQSQTANLFQSILEKKDSGQPSTPRKAGNGFQTSSTTPAGPPPTSLFASKPAADTTSGSNIFGNIKPAPASAASANPFSPKPSSQATPSSANVLAPKPAAETSSGSNIFGNLKSAPANATSTALFPPKPSSQATPSPASVFASKAVAEPTSGSNLFGNIKPAPPSAASTALFSSKPSSQATPSHNIFSQKPNNETSQHPSLDGPKAAKTTSSSNPFASMTKASSAIPASQSSSLYPNLATAKHLSTGESETNPPVTSSTGPMNISKSTTEMVAPPASNNFHFKPRPENVSANVTSSAPSFTAPASKAGFLAQFGAQASKDSEKLAAEAKARQKAEEFDSEDDDEEAWERKYAEEQAKKKEQAASQNATAPVFSAASPSVNFLSQFSKSAEQSEAEAKAKRKAEEFDSEDDDEEEWERNYAEEQRQKKAKLTATAEARSVSFVPGKGFVSGEAPSAKQSMLPPTATSETQKPRASPASGSGESVFSSSGTKRSHAVASGNIFGHLSNQSSRNASEVEDDGSDADDDEDTPHKKSRTTGSMMQENHRSAANKDVDDDETIEETMRRRSQNVSEAKTDQANMTPGKTLFDRITPADQESVQSKDSGEGSPPRPFGLGKTSNGITFGIDPTNGDKTNSDHTWKVDSPIKFGSSTTAFKFTPATPSKPVTTDGTETTTPAGRPFASLFNSVKADGSSNPFGAQKSNEVGFGFGGPPKVDGSTTPSSLFPAVVSKAGSALTSAATSRATSPGVLDSTNDDSEDAAPPEVQSDFTALTAEEKREEDVLFEVEKARCSYFNKDADQPWEVKGTGPLRVLKSKSNGTVRVLQRIAPTGKVVINSRVQKSYIYSHAGKGQTRFGIIGATGKPETYIVKMARDEDAKRFAEVCESNK